MSDTENKLLERVAALESELSIKRKNDGLDKRRATLDPLNYFKEQGLDVDHMTRVFVANAMGKSAPPELTAMVQQGPQILATSNLESMVKSLAETVKAIVDKDKEKELVASVKNTTVDPSKYPTLAAAIKTDPSILDSELKSLGTIADSSKALEQIENRLTPYAKAFGWKPPTSESKDGTKPAEVKTETTTITDTAPQFRSANQGASGSEVPPLLLGDSGVMTDDMHEKLKAAVLKKYSSVS